MPPAAPARRGSVAAFRSPVFGSRQACWKEPMWKSHGGSGFNCAPSLARSFKTLLGDPRLDLDREVAAHRQHSRQQHGVVGLLPVVQNAREHLRDRAMDVSRSAHGEHRLSVFQHDRVADDEPQPAPRHTRAIPRSLRPCRTWRGCRPSERRRRRFPGCRPTAACSSSAPSCRCSSTQVSSQLPEGLFGRLVGTADRPAERRRFDSVGRRARRAWSGRPRSSGRAVFKIFAMLRVEFVGGPDVGGHTEVTRDRSAARARIPRAAEHEPCSRGSPPIRCSARAKRCRGASGCRAPCCRRAPCRSGGASCTIS